jgi:eukaryotic-like serine/threonine-protein kinase
LSRVYLAREELPERDVVIKVLDEASSARLGRTAFMRRVQIASQLGHPHIVPIYAAGEAGDELYYVMPYIDGESLRDRLERDGPLPIDEAITIARQVADALHHAHGEGVVHRDVKPSNILFQGRHAVIADFGIARALGASGEGEEESMDSAAATPAYMSPEQAGASLPVDGRSDLYSLACVLYEMLAGTPPFEADSPQATLSKQLGDDVPPLRGRQPDVPPAVEAVITRALSKAPADRYASVADFSNALRRAAELPSGGSPERAPETKLGSGVIWPTVGSLVVLGLMALFWQALSAGDRAARMTMPQYRDSVAVMPFGNRSGDAAFDNLGRSMADEVIGHLTKIPEIKVIGSYSVESLWSQNLGIPRLLDTLNVGHLIEGSYEIRGNELVVSVTETGQDGVVRDRSTFTAKLISLDSAQLVIAHEIAEGYLGRVGVSTRVSLGQSEYGPARDAYISGKSWLGQRTPEGVRRAAQQFQHSVELESDYAQAHAALSSAYALALYYKYDIGLTAYDLAARALLEADRAVELDADLADGYASRGYIRALLGIDIDGAEADFDRAAELAPNAPNAPSWSARILAQRGRTEEAFRQARRAADLDPLQAGRRTALVSLAFQLGNYLVAIEEAREAVRLQPQLTLATAFEGRALALTGRGDECLELDFGVYDLVRALCLRQVGRGEGAMELVDDAEATLASGGSGDPDYLADAKAQDLAAFYGFSGDAAGATRWLRIAFDLSPTGIDSRILGSALFDPVRADPGYAAAERQVREQARKRVLDEQARLESAPR